ncbi:MAG TPA: HupE/UreJ family protein, partial [Moraxellaceae bacterium]|nr:HupE/UreJ family protein [Moraxellaceae bacterium]
IAALHNVVSERPGTRWIMAFGFGLVHGLGFASVLGELPSATVPRLVALAGFNAGVEVGQMLVVAAFLPLAISFARHDRLGYRRWGVQAGSLAIAVLAFVWLCQRMFDLKLIPG